jgi:hypothetical protein
MEHILIHCRATPTTTIWHLARETWPHDPDLWPDITIGTILGCGSICIPIRDDQANAENIPINPASKGMTRLLQILISEAAHLIWVLRCEREIRLRTHSANEAHQRWTRAINIRLTDDKIIASKIKRDASSVERAKSTWEDVLRKHMDLPDDWITSREVLVGIRSRFAPAPVGHVP